MRIYQSKPRPIVYAIAALSLCTLQAWAASPDWLRAATRDSLPKYPDDVRAVMLRSEQTATVSASGEVTTRYRHAYKILRPEGRGYGVIRIFFDSETRITSLKGWSIPSTGKEFEVAEKDSVETAIFSGNLYDDDRQKVLRIPAVDPGTVLGYEYEQRGRPSIPQDFWLFQQEIPVRVARFTLRLPQGWEYRAFWANHSEMPPQPGGANQFTWELRDIPAIREERAMPAWQSVAGQVRLRYIGANGGGATKSWIEVGKWYGELVARPASTHG